MQHQVITTEKVPFTYRVAGVGSRSVAWLIDGSLIMLLGFVGVIASSILESARGGVGTAVVALWVFALLWGYFFLFEWLWHGQTPGKRLVGIRVVHWRGSAISVYEAAVRNLLRFVDSLPLFYGVGFLIAACNRRHRRLGDLAAGTLVVHVDGEARPIQAVQGAGGADPGSDLATIRRRALQLNRSQKQTLVDLCLRREQLSVQDRTRLFAAAADFLQQRFEQAPAAFESAEKFVLRLTQALANTEQVRSS